MARDNKQGALVSTCVLVAVEPLLHDGREVAPGQQVEVTAEQAVALMVSGAAITPEQAQALAEALPPDSDPANT